MSKIINQLTSEDFGKSFDEALFSQWKKSVEEHEKASITTLVLYAIGLAAMILLGGFVGIGLFFVCTFVGLGIVMSKSKKRKVYESQLAINKNDIKNAVIKHRKRTN